jgi:hypothetical protein
MRFFNEIFLLPAEADKTIFQYYPQLCISSLLPATKRHIVTYIKSLGTQEMDIETPLLIFRQNIAFNARYVHDRGCNCDNCRKQIYRWVSDYNLNALKIVPNDKKIWTKPYMLGNVDRVGQICWGQRGNGVPPNMRHAHSFFWSSPFNMDHWPPYRNHSNRCPTLAHDCPAGVGRCQPVHRCVKRQRNQNNRAGWCQAEVHVKTCVYNPEHPRNPVAISKRETWEREQFNRFALNLAYELQKREPEPLPVVEKPEAKPETKPEETKPVGLPVVEAAVAPIAVPAAAAPVAPEPAPAAPGQIEWRVVQLDPIPAAPIPAVPVPVKMACPFDSKLLFKAISKMVMDIGLPLPNLPKPVEPLDPQQYGHCGCPPACVCCRGQCRCQVQCLCCLQQCQHRCACKLEERFQEHLKTYTPEKDMTNAWADETRIVLGDRYIATPKHADAVFVTTETEVMEKVPKNLWRTWDHDEEQFLVAGFATRTPDGWEIKIEDFEMFLEPEKVVICSYIQKNPPAPAPAAEAVVIGHAAQAPIPQAVPPAAAAPQPEPIRLNPQPEVVVIGQIPPLQG